MTVTTVEAPQTSSGSGPALHFDKAQELMNVISNAMLFTAKKSAYLPMLYAVKFERTGDVLTVVATDRYRLFTQTVEHTTEDGTEFDFLLDFELCKQAVQVLKTAGPFLGAILVVEEKALRVVVGHTEIVLPFLEDHSFPQWRKLVPSVDDAKDTRTLAFNPAFLAALGKLKLTGDTVAQFHFYGDGKPVRVSFLDGPVIMQMPIRIR